MKEKITIEIELGNDAMQTPRQVVELLKLMTAAILYDGWDAAMCYRDANGNTVGRMKID